MNEKNNNITARKEPAFMFDLDVHHSMFCFFTLCFFNFVEQPKKQQQAKAK